MSSPPTHETLVGEPMTIRCILIFVWNKFLFLPTGKPGHQRVTFHWLTGFCIIILRLFCCSVRCACILIKPRQVEWVLTIKNDKILCCDGKVTRESNFRAAFFQLRARLETHMASF